jgi:hypothetical protein
VTGNRETLEFLASNLRMICRIPQAGVNGRYLRFQAEDRIEARPRNWRKRKCALGRFLRATY